MNAQMEKAEAQSKSFQRMDSKIFTTKRDSLDAHRHPGVEEAHTGLLSQGPGKFSIGSPSLVPSDSATTSTSAGRRISGDRYEHSGIVSEIQDDTEDEMREEDIRRRAEVPDGVLNAEHPDLVPWPLPHEVQLRQTHIDREGKENKTGQQAILDTGEHAPVLPTVEEEQEASASARNPPEDEEIPIDAVTLAQQTNLVLTSLSASVEEQDLPKSQSDESPPTDSVRKFDAHSIKEKKIPENSPFADQPSPENRSPVVTRSKGNKFTWPPPSPSPQPREEPAPRPMRSALGKLPQPSNKPVPNAALLSEEQLKTELRTRAVDVEEAVRALKTACTTMQPQHMRSVMEKRLHMELTMAANLAEQQEAVVNLALAGLEKVRRTAPGTDLEVEEMSLTVTASLNKTESLVSKMMQLVTDPSPNEIGSQLQRHLQEIMQELEDLRDKTASRPPLISREGTLSTPSTVDVERSISTLRERADDLTKEKEWISRARGDLHEDGTAEGTVASRRTWADKTKEDKERREGDDDLTPDVYSDDDAAPTETLSRILHSND